MTCLLGRPLRQFVRSIYIAAVCQGPAPENSILQHSASYFWHPNRSVAWLIGDTVGLQLQGTIGGATAPLF